MLYACLLHDNFIEFSFTNITLTASHIQDFILLLNSTNVVESIKFEYITNDSNPTTELYRSFSHLLINCNFIKYISFRGNQFDDDFLQNITESLKGCVTIEYFNLSENRFTNRGVQLLIDTIQLSVSLKYINLKRNYLFSNNDLNDSFKTSWISLIYGKLLTSSDDVEIKNITKTIADINKKIKDINKTRKKSNMPEMNEVEGISTRIIKLPGNGGSIYRNNSLEYVDISMPRRIIGESDYVSEEEKNTTEHPEYATSSNDQKSSTSSVPSIGSEISTFFQSIHRYLHDHDHASSTRVKYTLSAGARPITICSQDMALSGSDILLLDFSGYLTVTC